MKFLKAILADVVRIEPPRPEYIPADYTRVRIARRFHELKNPDFSDGVNLIVLPRPLDTISHEFTQLALWLGKKYSSGADSQRELRLENVAIEEDHGPDGTRRAARIIARDMRRCEAAGYKRTRLRVVFSSALNGNEHHDGGKHRLLAEYTGRATRIFYNEDVKLLREGGSDYALRPGAPSFSCGAGDIWVQAGYENTKNVPPVVHQAPPITQDRPEPRLLLVADLKNYASVSTAAPF